MMVDGALTVSMREDLARVARLGMVLRVDVRGLPGLTFETSDVGAVERYCSALRALGCGATFDITCHCEGNRD